MSPGRPGSSRSRGTAVFLLSHTLHRDVADRFRKLVGEAPEDHEVLLALDVTETGPEGRSRARNLAGDRLEPFRASDVRDPGYPDPWAVRDRRSLVPGNLDLLYLHLARVRPGYRHYWFVEYDVVFTGIWSTLLGHFHHAGADLLGTTIHRYATNPDWYWWPRFRPPGGLEEDRWLRGFFPVLRLSRDALGALDAAYRAGWSGHAEAVLPTVMWNHGLDLRDIGGDGPFVAEGDRNRFYWNCPDREWLGPGSLVYRPAKPRPGREPATLWHPVKPHVGRVRSALRLVRKWVWAKLIGR